MAAVNNGMARTEACAQAGPVHNGRMTNSRILRWGLLSTARINRSVMAPLRDSRRNTLIGVASRDRAKVDAYAAEWKIDQAYDSYEAMLASPDIDVVYISLPNSMHAEWTIKALQAGKHVLCEKPLANTPEEAQSMADAARANKRVLAEAFMYRHHPQTLKVKELVDSGAIGEVRLIRGSFSFQINSESNIRLNAGLGGGGVWDVGCYPVSYARHIVGSEPSEVFGAMVKSASGVDDTFAGLLRWSNSTGTMAQFDSSLRAPFRTHIEIVGSTGMITVPRPFKPEAKSIITIGPSFDEVDSIAIDGPEQLYSGEIEDMADAILDGKAPRISLEDSIANVRVIQALYRSAASNRPERI